MKTTIGKSVAWAVAILVSGLGMAPSWAQAEVAQMQVRIDAQPLDGALNAWAAQTGYSVLVSFERAAQGKMAPRVEGSYTPEAALKMLLASTDLRYEFVNKRTVAIRAEARTGADVKGAGGETQLVQGDTSSSVEQRQGDGRKEPSSSADAEGKAPSSGISEIVVTAQKRQENLQDVPISISVLSGDQLDSSRVQGVSEALSRVPGVSLAGNQQGGGTQLSVRGITTYALFSGSSPVGYYANSIPFGFNRHAIAPDPSAYDLERVEVLRGPQGTLYGAGGMGGVVRVLSHDADLNTFEFKARTSVSSTEGGSESYRGDMALNVPIGDKLAVRAVAGYNGAGGWIDSPSTKDINDARLANYRLTVKAQPTDNLSVQLFSWISRSDYDALALSNDDDKFDSDLRQPTLTDFDAYGVTLSYQFPSFSVTSSTSYIDFSNNTDQDLDWLFVGLFGQPPDNILVTNLSARVWSEEVVLNSTTDGSLWEWSTGAIYRDNKDRTEQPFTVAGVSFINQDNTGTSKSYAVFGELHRWLVREQLKLTAGLRYFNDDAGFRGHVQSAFFDHAASYDALTPRVVLTWLPSSELTLYASYAEGFRSGFLQDTTYPPAEPDTVTNYEIGTKGSWFDRRISYEAALYFSDWQDIQQGIIALCQGPGFALPVPCFPITNAGSASGLGVDFALSVVPVNGVTLGVSLGWNDLTYDADILARDGSGAVAFEGGLRIANSPEYTANAVADYVFPIGGRLEGRLSGSVNYTSGRRGGLSTSSPLLIGKAGFSIGDADHWTATAYVENLTNERDSIYLGITPEWSGRERPRTFGLQLEFRY